MLNLNKCTKKLNLNLNQHSSLRTAHMFVRIILHNCRTQHKHRAVLIIFPLILQTVITAHMMSTGGELGIHYYELMPVPGPDASSRGLFTQKQKLPVSADSADLRRSRGTRWRLFVDLVTTFRRRRPSTWYVGHRSAERQNRLHSPASCTCVVHRQPRLHAWHTMAILHDLLHSID